VADRHTLRSGFTTGTAAAASAKLAALALFGRLPAGPPYDVDIPLPDGARLTVTVSGLDRLSDSRMRAVTVKDGGDDPDVTHGALIGCTVALDPALAPGEARIEGGPGVGRVTLPGLLVPVGQAAINPGPLAQIRAALAEAAAEAAPPAACGLAAVIDVEGGQALAARTMNPRLGITGGISILGTSGIVRPFSHEAWQGAVAEALDVARALGIGHAGLSTGRRSEKALRGVLPHLPEQAFAQIADFFAFSLAAAAARGFAAVTLCAYPGKLVKMAMGLGNTHAHLTATDFAALAGWCAEAGIAAEACAAVATANTVRHAFELVRDDPAFAALPGLLAEKALAHARSFAGPGPALSLLALDFDDRPLCQTGLS
jgi:cobalt-precorrin-5B (C1)-methyltransferase